mmetsp:Transcript_66456/g.156882  ORF Transcript_66456/g.156882 Transcript_66456/m.156882 type:complete len:224 (+) Transcript_66456:3-674(+)
MSRVLTPQQKPRPSSAIPSRARVASQGLVKSKSHVSEELREQQLLKAQRTAEAAAREADWERRREQSRREEAELRYQNFLSKRAVALQTRDENMRMAAEKRRQRALAQGDPQRQSLNYRGLLESTVSRHCAPQDEFIEPPHEDRFIPDGGHTCIKPKGGDFTARVNRAMQDDHVTPWRVASETEQDWRRLRERHTPRYAWMTQRNPITWVETGPHVPTPHVLP